MKLNSALVEQAVDQLGVEPIPEQHPAMPQLNQVFGDHTFFVDINGLYIVEPAEAPDAGATTGEVLTVARWSDDSRTALAPQPPEPTGTVIVFAGDDPESAA
jgi:hypothetical protein